MVKLVRVPGSSSASWPVRVWGRDTYAMRACEDQDAPGVIAGNFTLYDIEMHALVDPSSTHSNICIECDKLSSIEPLAYDMHVTSPLGHSVRVNRVYKNCPLIVLMIENFQLI